MRDIRNALTAGTSAKLSIAAMLLFAASPVFAQALPPPAEDDSAPQEGINGVKYNVKSTAEFGGRFTDITGNQNVYNTFVNLQQGARLLSFTTEMRALDHHGDLFDQFYVSAFGWGGDPNDVARVRINKFKWYDFNAIVRRDENAWDYSILANPLNPTAGFVNGPAGFGPLATSTCTGCIIGVSPHDMNTRRYLSDYNLIFLPESKVRFRAGYARNIVSGPSFSSIHLGTDFMLAQNTRTTINSYRFGVDYRVLPRTNISYDQTWTDYKGDTGAFDDNQTFRLANGTPVDLGVPLNATLNQPCSNTFLAAPAGAANSVCNALLFYNTNGRVRTSAPTEQLSMQSSYFKNIDFSGRFSYTGASSYDHSYFEGYNGLTSKSNLRDSTTNGNIFGQRVAASADAGVTWHITDRFSFLDSFHYSNFHDPMEFNSGNCSFFAPNLLTTPHFFNPTFQLPITCAPPSGSVNGAIANNTSSGPDIAVTLNGGFLKQDEKMNLAEVDYQISSKLGARVGFRYWHRAIVEDSSFQELEFFFPPNANRGDCKLAGTPPAPPPGCTPLPGGAFQFMSPLSTSSPDTTFINQYSGLFGVWYRPNKTFRISFDTELMSADNVFTRISPRQSQEYRIRSTYKPRDWFHLSGSVRIWEARDNVVQVDSLQHDRSYGVSATLNPNPKFAVDVTYDYNDIFSQILICYPNSTTPPGVGACPNVSGLLEQLSTYENHSHYGAADVMWRPIHPLTLHVGGNFTGTSGSALVIPPNSIPGSLNSKWLCPTGGMDYSFSKNWMGRFYWNYYGYHEDPVASPQDVFAPRNFRGNTFTLAARYSF